MDAKFNRQGTIDDYLKADIDDIVFEYRNKNYGGYLLRKLYPGNMTKANIIATVLFILAISLPSIINFVKKSLPQEETINAEVTLAEPPPLDPKAPPPPPPPKAEPPPKRPTIAFVAPKVKKDEEVTEEVAPPDVEDLKNIDISTKTQEGVENGAPEGLEEAEPAPPAPVLEEKVEKPEEIFKVVEQKPEFPDGEAAMLKFIYSNIKYPPIARENGVEGTAYVTFVVEKDGSITDVKVVRDIGAGCGEEAVRVVKMMPKWNPGKQRGRPVRVQFNLPVKYKLE